MEQTRTWLRYRQEAQRVRQLAEMAANQVIRDQLLAIAKQFHELAESAERAAKH